MATDTGDHTDAGAPERDHAGRQMSFTVLATALGMPLRYVAALITTRLLGAGLFGTYVQAQAITQVLGTAATLGLAPGAVPIFARERLAEDPPRLRATVRAALAISLTASLLVSAALFVLAPWLARSVFDDPALASVLRWLAPAVVLIALLLTTQSVLQGFKAMRAHAVAETIVPVCATLAALVAVWALELGLYGVLGATLLGPAAALACSATFAGARVPGVLQAREQAAAWPARSLVATCWPLLGTSLIAFALSSLDVFMLGLLSEPAEVGVYGASARLLPLVFVVHGSATQMFFAHASERYAAGDLAGLEAFYKRTGRWSIWSATGAALLLILWGPQVLGMFGPEFAAGGPVLSALALGHAAVAWTGSCGKALLVIGRLRQNMFNVLAMLGINVALNLLWIPEHGAYGAACATLTARFAVRLAQAAQVWWTLRIHPWSPDSALALVCAWLLYTAVQQVLAGPDEGAGWIAAAAGSAALWAALYLALGTSREDRGILVDLLRRRR